MQIAHVTATFPPITLVDELLVKPGNVDDLAEKIQWPFHPSTPFGHLLTDEGKRELPDSKHGSAF
jgi:hypothetical protein